MMKSKLTSKGDYCCAAGSAVKGRCDRTLCASPVRGRIF